MTFPYFELRELLKELHLSTEDIDGVVNYFGRWVHNYDLIELKFHKDFKENGIFKYHLRKQGIDFCRLIVYDFKLKGHSDIKTMEIYQI